MPKKRNVILFIQDILEASANIEEFTQNMEFEEYFADKKNQGCSGKKSGRNRGSCEKDS
ncbi:MAG: hypothetical protein K0A89_10130 [ANME-2 cluster archaeon]|nr:hypothetical protein [ANME-2 cluster archaeon]